MTTTAKSLAIARALLANAICPEDVFGTNDVGRAYRRLVADVHPDHFVDDPVAHASATKALEQLNEWKRQADAKVEAGTYGDRTAPVPEPPRPADPPVPVVITIGKRGYRLGRELFAGDVATLYACRAGLDDVAVCKVARHAGDSDLLDAERVNLKKATDELKPRIERHFLPQLLDSFVLRGASGMRRANVLSRHDDHYSLDEVLGHYPNGLDFRDLAWMLNRSLQVLGAIHRAGLVHGAVLPPHLLVHPVNHGAKLVGWGASVAAGQHLRAALPRYRACYPPEVAAKKPATPGTDIYQLASTAMFVLGGVLGADGAITMPNRVPRPIQAFLHGCRLASPARRPTDAWALHGELAELLERLVGPKRYRPFHMPARSPA